jgi:hypothetical protein
MCRCCGKVRGQIFFLVATEATGEQHCEVGAALLLSSLMNGFVIDSSKIIDDLRAQLLAERKKRTEQEERNRRLESKLKQYLASDSDGHVNGSPHTSQVRPD